MIATGIASTRTGATRRQPVVRSHSVPTARVAYAAAASGPTFSHECHQGFCTVCGSVWPCSRAVKWAARQTPPVMRLAALAS